MVAFILIIFIGISVYIIYKCTDGYKCVRSKMNYDEIEGPSSTPDPEQRNVSLNHIK